MAGRQDANSGFLRNKSFVKPETKDFHSFYCYNCLILFACWVTESEVRHDQWKLSSAQPTPCHGICQGFAALDRCSFCHYVTIKYYQHFYGRRWHWTHLSCRPSCGWYIRMAQFAAPVADHFGRKQFCIRHCFMVKASQWENKHIFRVPAIGFHQSHIMAMGLWVKTHDSQFEGCPSIDPKDFHNFDAHHGTFSQHIATHLADLWGCPGPPGWTQWTPQPDVQQIFLR